VIKIKNNIPRTFIWDDASLF